MYMSPGAISSGWLNASQKNKMVFEWLGLTVFLIDCGFCLQVGERERETVHHSTSSAQERRPAGCGK